MNTSIGKAELLGEAIEPRDPLLVEREATHGSFSTNAARWDNVLYYLGESKMPKPEHRLALTMIALKLARMMSNPEEKDHWIDIAGYAKLGAEACDK